jgi:hypothetical protein
VLVARHGVFLDEFLSKERSGSKITLEKKFKIHFLMLRIKPKWNKFQVRQWNKFSRHRVSEGQGE